MNDVDVTAQFEMFPVFIEQLHLHRSLFMDHLRFTFCSESQFMHTFIDRYNKEDSCCAESLFPAWPAPPSRSRKPRLRRPLNERASSSRVSRAECLPATCRSTIAAGKRLGWAAKGSI